MFLDDFVYFFIFFSRVSSLWRIAFNTKVAGCKFTAHKWNIQSPKITERNRRNRNIYYKLFLKTCTQAVVNWKKKKKKIKRIWLRRPMCECVRRNSNGQPLEKQWSVYAQCAHLPFIFFLFLAFNVLFGEMYELYQRQRQAHQSLATRVDATQHQNILLLLRGLWVFHSFVVRYAWT